MSNKLKYNVSCKEEGLTLREYFKRAAGLSSRLIKSAARENRITVNSKLQKLNYILKMDDIIELNVEKEESQNVEPEFMELNIAYEDIDVIVVNKPPGIVVHPTRSYPSGTLANGLLFYFKERGENCIVRLVSRLDMDTSGLILIAKNQFSHMALARDMQEESFEKAYLAVVHGNLKDKEGTIDLPIYRPLEDTIKRTVDERGQRSVTHYKVIESYPEGDLVRLILETGRTHQIRVHLSHLGHPIFGDTLYGLEDDNKLIKRQALHAYKLGFPHPKTGRKIVLETELPQDIKELIEYLKAEIK